MTLRRLFPLLFAAVALTCTMQSAPTQAAPQLALPDCLGKPLVKPAQVIFACADGNFSAQSLKWTGWGESFAAATGVGEVNDCTPYCAAGKFHKARIVIIASGVQRCPDGRPAYSTVTYAWIGRPPFPPGAGAANPVQTFSCGSKP